MVLPTFCHLGDEGVGEEVEEGVPGEGAHGQGDQELDEVLVEDPLHDRDHNHPEHAAEGDEEDGARGGEPDPVVLHHPPLLQPHVRRVVAILFMPILIILVVVMVVAVMLVRAVVVALVLVHSVLVVVVVLGLVLVLVVGGVGGLLAAGHQGEAEQAEAVAHVHADLQHDREWS